MGSDLPSIEQLIRHRGPMLLVDELIEATETRATGVVTITEASAFYRQGLGVPSYVGLEYMAQTVAAFDGLRRLRAGDDPEIGFLLGTRRYSAGCDYFARGDKLRIEVGIAFSGEEIASFDCVIQVDGGAKVTATLSVYRPGEE